MKQLLEGNISMPLAEITYSRCTCILKIPKPHWSVSNGFVSSKIYDKRDDFDFDIVNFPFLDGDVPRSTYLLHQP